MPDTINLPILGQTSKGTVAVSVAAAAAVGGYVLWKHEKAKAAATNTTSNQPANSYGYGQMTGTNMGANSYGYGMYGGYGYSYGGGYGSGLEPSEYYGYGQGTTEFANNAEWVQYATSQLNNAGYTETTVLAALGLYINGGTLNASQVAIVQQAIAVAGYPPIEGSGGYPPNYHTQTSTGQNGGSGTTSAVQIPVPNVVGEPKGEAHNVIVAAQLHPIDGGWKKGDAKAIVKSQTPTAGTMVSQNATVTYK